MSYSSTALLSHVEPDVKLWLFVEEDKGAELIFLFLRQVLRAKMQGPTRSNRSEIAQILVVNMEKEQLLTHSGGRK